MDALAMRQYLALEMSAKAVSKVSTFWCKAVNPATSSDDAVLTLMRHCLVSGW